MALTEVKKCIYPIKVIEHLFNENRLFSQVLIQSLTQHLASNHKFWIEINSRNGMDKVKYVYSLLEELGVEMSIITQDDLALIAGISRITVARAYKQIYE